MTTDARGAAARLGPTTTGSVARRYAPLAHTQVTLDDPIWAPRQQVNRERTLDHVYEQCLSTGRIDALSGHYAPAVVARGLGGGNHPVLFWDSDVAKWIEAASYSLADHPDPELDALLDQVIARIAGLQGEDGYFNSWFIAVHPEQRWINLRDWHELYNAGHLIEAAVAHFQATGKRSLLDVMIRYVDYIATVFGPGEEQRRGYCGHPEIELALVRLFHATGERRFLDLASYFVDERGAQPHYYDQESLARGEQPAPSYEYSQSHRPVREQDEVVGHAVRAAYLYSAMADLAAETGDAALLATCQRLWGHLTTRRMYVMGGIGSSRHNEGFTSDYDLPNESAYAETCAAIALVFWGQRMLQLDLDRRYADVMELALYNAVLSGISLDGAHFFYDNPLASKGAHHRQEWFVCPCCPPNVARLLASIGGYLYAQSDDEVVAHLYAQSRAELQLRGQAVRLRQETSYPWDGAVSITLGLDAPLEFALRLRVPSWCKAPGLTINGEAVDLAAALEGGYATLRRTWQDGDAVALELPMPVERVYAHPAVAADVASIALRRGPIVFCVEQADHEAPIQRLLLPASAPLEARFDPELLGGVVVVEGQAVALQEAGWESELYRSTPPSLAPCALHAIPYATWDNRGPGAMSVWLKEQPA
jgi:DUF1680 family protein